MKLSAEKIKITPNLGIALAGYGGSIRPCEGFNGDLEVQVMAVKDQGRNLMLFVALDTLYVGKTISETILSVASEFNLSPELVWIAASHTHFAPATDRSKPSLGNVDDIYLDQLSKKIEDIIKKVLQAKGEEVSIEFSSIDCEANVNRRLQRFWPTWTREGFKLTGGTMMAPAKHKLRDKEIAMFRFISKDGGCLAIIWKYACHPVGFTPSNYVSPDFPGVVRSALRKHNNNAFLPVIFLQGFAGDVRPLIEGATDTRGTLRRLRSGPSFGTPTFAQWRQWANTISDSVLNAWTSTNWTAISPTLHCRSTSIPFSELFEFKKPESYFSGQLFIQHAVFGNSIELLGGNAEFCSPWLKLGSPHLHTVHVGYLGNVFGYLPSEQQYREGGYEAIGFMAGIGVRNQWLRGFENRIETRVNQMLVN